MILEEGTKDQLLDCMVAAMTPQLGERWCYCYEMAKGGDWFTGTPFNVTDDLTKPEYEKLLRDNAVNGMLVKLA
jgi:hypothetical protein